MNFWIQVSLALMAQVQPGLRPDQFPNADPASVLPLLTRTAPAPAPALPTTQKVGPGDLISVTVMDCPELTRNFRVGSDGWLTLPLLKRGILAEGKEAQEIELQITNALVNEELLVRPAVIVAVTEYRSVPVIVMGAVKHPITFQAVGTVTLLDALARAEGLTAEAGADVMVSRSRGALTQRISLTGLIRDADPALNIRLVGGEEVRVPTAGKVFVAGNVRKPGAYPIQDGNETSILKMIAMSEGLLPFSSKDAFIYRQGGEPDQRDEIRVEIGKLINRKAPDVALQANDILYVPDNKGRRITMQTMERVLGIGAAAGTGVMVLH